MAVFVALCLLSRLAYSLNDIFVGRLARVHGRMEVAGWRGVSLVVTMAPLLFWVPREAWVQLGRRWDILLLTVVATGGCNVLQMQAARYLPFGLRAAFLVTGISVGSILFGWWIFAESLSGGQLALAGLLVGSAVVAAPGVHASHEIVPNIRRGAAVAFAAALLMAVVVLLVAKLARETHPFLAAWAWEGGAGVVFLLPMVWRARGTPLRVLARRVLRIGAASAPTAVGSGASVLALTLGAVGVWGALAGTQVLFTAVLGAMWHREIMGLRRWICFGVAAAAVSGLAILKS